MVPRRILRRMFFFPYRAVDSASLKCFKHWDLTNLPQQVKNQTKIVPAILGFKHEGTLSKTDVMFCILCAKQGFICRKLRGSVENPWPSLMIVTDFPAEAEQEWLVEDAS